MMRWMKTQEIYNLLTSENEHILGELPHQPPSGSYYLIKPNRERGWKKDGYNYTPRHNGIGTREDVEKLKLNGVPVIICLYSQTVTNMHRRIYKLIEGDKNLHMVHYFEQQPEEANSLITQDEILIQRIQQLEQRIITLEQEKMSNSTYKDSQDDISFSFKEYSYAKVVDYSPDWDYEQGGMKMMICYQPLRELYDVVVQFGDVHVDAHCLQPGVLKCIIPAHPPGIVDVKVEATGVYSDSFGFEFKKKRKVNKKQQQTQIIQDHQYQQSEFKVRVIEKLTSFQNYLFEMDHSNNDIFESIEELNEQCLMNVIKRIIDVSVKQKCDISLFFDKSDQHGFTLIHYLTVLNYQQAIKLIIHHGANINQFGLDNVTALQIAIILQNEEMVQLLIQLGAIDQSFAENDTKTMDHLFSIETIYENKNILDLLIRGVTLCDSIHNSSDQQWNDQDDQEECYLILNDFQEAKEKTKQSHHKYYRNYSKPKQQNKYNEFNTNKPYDNYSDHIKVIQKNVRAWLLRRQYLDMKYATQVLQNCKFPPKLDIRTKILKKNMNADDECKSKIKSTLRNWLNLKD